MYPPLHHQEANFENTVRIIRQFPFATLVSANGDDCFITHAPLIYEDNGSEFGKLVGHIDRNNPHCDLLDNRKIQIIFHGPDTYISPKYYSTRQLPTWNYIKVHMEGVCRITRSVDQVRDSIVRMTEFLEGSDDSYVLESDNRAMAGLINYIIGFEIQITTWEGKFKLSQDKNPADMEGAKKALIRDSKKAIEEFIEEIYRNHTTKRLPG